MAKTVAANAVGTDAFALTAATVETVTFGEDLKQVEVVYLSGTDTIWYTLDGSTPTVSGANSYVVPPNMYDSREPKGGDATVVKLISAGTPTVRVQRGD